MWTRTIRGRNWSYVVVAFLGIAMGVIASPHPSRAGGSATVPPVRIVSPFSDVLHEKCDASGECVIGDTADILAVIPAAMGRADVSITYSFSYESSPGDGARMFLTHLCDGTGGTVHPRKFLLAPSPTTSATSLTWVLDNLRAEGQTCGFAPELRLRDQSHPGHVGALGGTLVIEVSQHAG
jgi:hypothetical protein